MRKTDPHRAFRGRPIHHQVRFLPGKGRNGGRSEARSREMQKMRFHYGLAHDQEPSPSEVFPWLLQLPQMYLHWCKLILKTTLLELISGYFRTRIRKT